MFHVGAASSSAPAWLRPTQGGGSEPGPGQLGQREGLLPDLQQQAAAPGHPHLQRWPDEPPTEAADTGWAGDAVPGGSSLLVPLTV